MPTGYIPANINPVRKRKSNSKLTSFTSRQMPELNIAAAIPQIKNTFEGEKISDMAKKAKTSVPLIKPSCTMLVRLAKRFVSAGKCLVISGNTALPANQSEVQRN